MEHTCETCGQAFTRKLGGPDRPSRFCSKKCFGRSITTKIEKTCLICGAPFHARTNTLARGFGTYCSKACSNRARKRPLEDRFWEMVPRLGPDECWPFTGPCDGDGYGVITGEEGRRQLRASRVAYELQVGPIPAGKCVMHSCDNPPCCNARHLSVGTKADNNHDRWLKGRYY